MSAWAGAGAPPETDEGEGASWCRLHTERWADGAGSKGFGSEGVRTGPERELTALAPPRRLVSWGAGRAGSGDGAGRRAAGPAAARALLWGAGAAERRAPSFKWTLLSLAEGSAGGSGRAAAIAAALLLLSSPPPRRQVGCARPNASFSSFLCPLRGPASPWGKAGGPLPPRSGTPRCFAPLPALLPASRPLSGEGGWGGAGGVWEEGSGGLAEELGRPPSRWGESPGKRPRARACCRRAVGGSACRRVGGLRVVSSSARSTLVRPSMCSAGHGGLWTESGVCGSCLAPLGSPWHGNPEQPHLNKSYLQEVQCFILFRLILNAFRCCAGL